MDLVKSHKLLIVDDQSVNRTILAELFKDKYKILEAENGQQALNIVEQHGTSISAILLDLMMPVMDGFSFLENMERFGYLNEVPIIVITSDNSNEALIKSYSYNVADVIAKPFNPQVVVRRVKNIVELYMHKNHLEKQLDVQTSILRKQEEKIRQTNDDIITMLTTTIEFRNGESGLHCQRIKGLTRILLSALMVEQPKYCIQPFMIEPVSNASQMHDIGKIAIPDSILLKPGPLSEEEFILMKTHTLRGCEMLESIKFTSDEQFFEYCYDICRYHHERFDGKGYPDGLSGNDIPIWAQVVSLADVYDALTSSRVYKEAYSHEEAVRMILNNECGTFNPDIIACFMSKLDEIEQIHMLEGKKV